MKVEDSTGAVAALLGSFQGVLKIILDALERPRL
jgi:hypothetical protein